jgi:hypothetical protein
VAEGAADYSSGDATQDDSMICLVFLWLKAQRTTAAVTLPKTIR